MVDAAVPADSASVDLTSAGGGSLRSRHSGFLIQSRYGARGNFELIVPHVASGLLHYWRSNDEEECEWNFQRRFARGDDLQHYRAVSFIHSNFGNNFDLVAVLGNALRHSYRDSEYRWRECVDIGLGVAGSPALIQSRFGMRGNFEVIVPSSGNGLRHFYRDNDVISRPWREVTSFAETEGHFSAAALLQSNYGEQFEVVATVGTKLLHYYRDERRNWQGPSEVADGVCGSPGFIQSHRGGRGNFEVVVPSCEGGLLHLYRDNDASKPQWHEAERFATSLGVLDAVSLVEGSFDHRLHVVAIAGSLLCSLREDEHRRWSDPTEIGRLDQSEDDPDEK